MFINIFSVYLNIFSFETGFTLGQNLTLSGFDGVLYSKIIDRYLKMSVLISYFFVLLYFCLKGGLGCDGGEKFFNICREMILLWVSGSGRMLFQHFDTL